MRTKTFSFFVSLTLVFTANCFAEESTEVFAAKRTKKPDLRYLTLLATNDIHGGIEPSSVPTRNAEKPGPKMGGMAHLKDVVDAIRRGIAKTHPGKAASLLLDAGDQFQGTLLSNKDEGKLLFELMEDIGYAAVIPGNHDYDFGPKGWLDDKVTKDTKDQDPRGVLKSIIDSHKKISFVSANTYIRDSLQNKDGKKIEVTPEHCAPKSKTAEIDWSKAKRADFLKPYEIFELKEIDAKVAIIGLDNPKTPSSTTKENVSDLCFRPIPETYREVREALEGKADIFVIVMHDGNIAKNFEASHALKEFVEADPPLVDAVVAGHTHSKNDLLLGPKGKETVPFIQSWSGGRNFGRINLVWDAANRKLVRDQIKKYAGLELLHGSCDKNADFCEEKGGAVLYDGAALVLDYAVAEKIEKAATSVKKEAEEKLATTKTALHSHRFEESALGDVFSEELRKFTLQYIDALPKEKKEKYYTDYGSDGELNVVSFLNAGGLRRSLNTGDITYQDLFEVIPFNNHGVFLAPVNTKRLIKLLDSNVKTCGKYGTLVFSGLKISYDRDCKRNAKVELTQIDTSAKLLKVEIVRNSGSSLIYDASKKTQPTPFDVLVSTLDFIGQGGENYKELATKEIKNVEVVETEVKEVEDFGVFREELKKYWLSLPKLPEFDMPHGGDGRYKNITPAAE